jgi:Na+-driven multidrug efflux pump
MFGISFVLASVVRAAGAVIAPLLIMIIAFVGLRVPAAIALTPLLGADAVYWAFPIGSGASLLMTTAYYCFGRWRVNRPIEDIAVEGTPDTVPVG